jgi:phosphohistidine phosphatase SixA
MDRGGCLATVALAIALTIAPHAAAQDADAVWAALASGGHVALIRHGNAPPGYGELPGFKIDDCATQRNLDDVGRSEARALGDAFRQHGVRVDEIHASPWCRCMETAELMRVGAVQRSWAIVPITSRNPERLPPLREMISKWRGPGTLVLVTHGFTIQALIGSAPQQAQTVVLKPTPGSGWGAQVVGTIATPR